MRTAIHKIDPFSLLEGGSPKDEFDDEIRLIIKDLKYCDSGNEVAHVIAKVLNDSFSENYSPENFREEAIYIFQAMVNINAS